MDGIETGAFVVTAAVAAAALTALALRARYGTTLAELGVARQQLRQAIQERDDAMGGRIAAERYAAAARQQAQDAAERFADLERLKQEIAQLAQAGVAASAQIVSSKLLDDHKREAVEQRKETEERVKQVNEELIKQLGLVANSLAQLKGQVTEKGQTLDKVMRALSSPGGSGQIAEIGLGNALRSFGLELNRDFFLQQTAVDEESGRRLRPDAVVMLPSNAVLVIDCKASKFILDIAEHEGTSQESLAYENLARTMNLHLKALNEKDYRAALLGLCRQAGRSEEPGRVISIMFLPNEAALEKLYRADPEFSRRARQAQIIPAGPAGLYCALSLATAEINFQRQIDNQREIVDRTRLLLDQIGVVLNYAGQVGKGIKTAADAFARLSSSVNGRLLPRARVMTRLGIQSAKQLPPNLPSFSVHASDDNALIDAEPAEIEPPVGDQRLLTEEEVPAK